MRRLAALAVLAFPAVAEAHPGYVDISGHAFKPARLTVTAGVLVEWRWDGPDTNHSVTGERFDSDPGESSLEVDHAKGDTFAVFFEDPGEYRYACKVHPSMEGAVLVEPAEATDERAPALTILGAEVVRGKAVVRFRVSERASVLAEARRRGRARLVADAFRFVGAGVGRIRVPVGRGRFSVRLQATDDAGNTSVTRTVSVRR